MEKYTLKVLNAVRDAEEDIYSFEEGNDRNMEKFA